MYYGTQYKSAIHNGIYIHINPVNGSPPLHRTKVRRGILLWTKRSFMLRTKQNRWGGGGGGHHRAVLEERSLLLSCRHEQKQTCRRRKPHHYIQTHTSSVLLILFHIALWLEGASESVSTIMSTTDGVPSSLKTLCCSAFIRSFNVACSLKELRGAPDTVRRVKRDP